VAYVFGLRAFLIDVDMDMDMPVLLPQDGMGEMGWDGSWWLVVTTGCAALQPIREATGSGAESIRNPGQSGIL